MGSSLARVMTSLLFAAVIALFACADGSDGSDDGGGQDPAADDDTAAADDDTAADDDDTAADDDTAGDDDVACGALGAAFWDELDPMVACDEDMECVAHDFGAPELAYCYTAVNWTADVSAAQGAADAWTAAGCSTQEYDCEPEPPPEPVCKLTHRCAFYGVEYEQCAGLREAFAAEADRINHCEDVSDCALVVVRNCGVMTACWIPIHAEEDQTELRVIEEEYGRVLCPYVTCSCPLPELDCQDGRCVELYR